MTLFAVGVENEKTNILKKPAQTIMSSSDLIQKKKTVPSLEYYTKLVDGIEPQSNLLRLNQTQVVTQLEEINFPLSFFHGLQGFLANFHIDDQ